jgi:N-acetylmuramoyl-L-alanine amidase
LSADVAEVLNAVEHGQSLAPAATLAVGVQKHLARVRGHQHDRGVRQDSHHVLLGATMPAVLVEVGFLDHPVEGAELTEARVQDQIAESIARAVAANLR